MPQDRVAYVPNTPSADVLLRLLHGAIAQPAYFANKPVLGGWREELERAASALDSAIAPRGQTQSVVGARRAADAADALYDRCNRHLYNLLVGYAEAPSEAQRQAAGALLPTLFPDKLLVTNRAWTVEAASGRSFAKKLALPEVAAAFAVLAEEVPSIAQKGDAIVQAALELGRTLDAVDQALAGEAGSQDSTLFTARVEAHTTFAAFVHVVESVAYASETPADKAARAALIGPYLRFLASGPTKATVAEPSDGGGTSVTATP